MLLSITTTYQPATDLGYLLHKHPDRVQTFSISSGQVHIFYPEANEEVCTVAMLVEIDPVNMVRNLRKKGQSLMLTHYVNDRPYTASSFTSTAIAEVFSTAMNGNCKSKPDLVDKKWPLEVQISCIKAKGDLAERFFAPLGYEILCERIPLNESFPEWGDSYYCSLSLKHELPIKDLLTHLYVLLPVLDYNKHYYVSKAEVEKLLSKGEDWLKDHPEKELITKRFLNRSRGLTRMALERLAESEGELEEETDENDEGNKEKEAVQISLHRQRLETVAETLKEKGARTVIDLGCGEGKLMQILLKEGQFEKITGVDVSVYELQKAKKRLHWETLSPRKRERLELFQSALTYRDKRLEGYDAAALVEVIEHLDADRLQALERALFEFAQPKLVVITTPNKDYNAKFENEDPDRLRHHDHRFEWTRQEFKDWAEKIKQSYRYDYEISLIGEAFEDKGGPSQMVVFLIT